MADMDEISKPKRPPPLIELTHQYMSFDSQQYSDDDDLHNGDGRNEIYIPVLLHAGQADKQKKKMKCEKFERLCPKFQRKRMGGRPSSSSSPSSSFLYHTFHFTQRVP